jgi:hypothetical protein
VVAARLGLGPFEASLAITIGWRHARLGGPPGIGRGSGIASATRPAGSGGTAR